MQRLRLQRRYTRSDPKGLFPRVTGRPELGHNRLGVFWRPLIDMTDSESSPVRLRMIRPVARWLADPASQRWPWFSRIGVAGLRHQVVRHAGLDRYDCREPGGLPPELRTREWDRLVDAIGRFAQLGYRARTLVVVQLTQLSYYRFALKLTGVVAPDGDPDRDRYGYEVARVHASCPGQTAEALVLLANLATSARDGLVALASCFQGIGHAIRNGNNLDLAREFEARGRGLPGLADGWHTCLVRSRFHRALALLRLAEGRLDEMRRELRIAGSLHDALQAATADDADRDDADRMVVIENRRYLLELELDAATRQTGGHDTGSRDAAPADEVRAWCAELISLDPYCVQARLTVGDAHAAVADYAGAALWYSRAGELGTGAGALGWFRAAQCHDFLGDRGPAVNAMGRLLELDATAVEARQYLSRDG